MHSELPHRELPGATDIAFAIAENSAQGIVVMDNDGHCLYANRAWTEITGFTAEDMQSRPVHDWVHHHHPDGRTFPIDECPIGATLGKNQNVRSHRDLFFRKDGTPFHVSCAASTAISEGAQVLKILEIRDITDEVEIEHRKDEFLAMLAHELRNPLAPIAAAADLLKTGRIDNAGMKQASAVISRQVSHMAGLINDLLDVARVTRGLIELERDDVDMKSVVVEAIEQVRPLIDAKRHWIAVNVNTTSDSALVSGDRKRLVQVLANILNNAAKYTPDGGEITVAIETDADAVQVTVIDNGIGMTAEMTQSAFELFTQAERTPDRTQGGLGIGLAIVRSLANLHGGSVAAHSDGPGTGTEVTLTLPKNGRCTAPAADVQASEKRSAASRSFRIMVVDDSKDVAQMLGMLLRALGHDTRVENDPFQALAAARNQPQDVFLLDIGLPGMDGAELARQLRQQPENSRALMVAVTGYGQEQDRRNTIAAGFDHHLVKPVKLQQLEQLLETLHKA